MTFLKMQSEKYGSGIVKNRNKSINFDTVYVGAILDGTKRTTIRKGIKEYHGHVSLTAGNTVFADAIIKNVVVKRFKQLKEEDAVLDGFSSLDELKNALKGIYEDIDEDDFFSIIYFDLLVG